MSSRPQNPLYSVHAACRELMHSRSHRTLPTSLQGIDSSPSSPGKGSNSTVYAVAAMVSLMCLCLLAHSYVQMHSPTERVVYVRDQASGLRMEATETDGSQSSLFPAFLQSKLLQAQQTQLPGFSVNMTTTSTTTPLTGPTTLCDPRDAGDAGSVLDEAEEIFKRNLARRNNLFLGAERGLVWPYDRSVQKLLDEWRTKPRDISEYDVKLLLMFYAQSLYPCVGEERLGAWGEHGKWVCRPSKLNHAVVYSIGTGMSTDFEKSVFDLMGVRAFKFDPAVDDLQQRQLKTLPFISFYPVGITGEENTDAVLRSCTCGPGARFMHLDDLTDMLGHAFVDILVMDCDGCEHVAIPKLLRKIPRDRPLYGQILIEIHELDHPVKVLPVFNALEEAGYRLFHTEENPFCWSCKEFAYIHENVIGHQTRH